MGVPTTLRGISATAASNSPAGSDAIGSSLDDYLRGIQAVVRQYLASPASNMASAATVDLSTADGFHVLVTGTTTTTAFGTEGAGIWYLLRANGAWPITHNATSLIILPHRGDITCTAGDLMIALSLGSGNWILVPWVHANSLTEDTTPDRAADYVQTYDASASATKKVLLGRLATTTTSGVTLGVATSVDITTSLPAWATKVTLLGQTVSTTGTSPLQIQVGTGGGYVTSNYAGNDSTNTAAMSSGFKMQGASTAAATFSFVAELNLNNGICWFKSSLARDDGTTAGIVTAVGENTVGTVDRIRITTLGGTDTFDNGVVYMNFS